MGDIHFRDRWQFELKSDYTPSHKIEKNVYTQEFYLFIPNALQVNQENYEKTDFYHDQTTLIRFKTPIFTLKQVLDPDNRESPLRRLYKLLDEFSTDCRQLSEVEYEMKLLANVIRSALRDETEKLSEYILEADTHTADEKNFEVKEFSQDILNFREEFSQLLLSSQKKPKDPILEKHFFYVDEFISNSINFYVTSLLEHVRERRSVKPSLSDEGLCDVLTKESKYRKQRFHVNQHRENSSDKEYIVYRRGLLNKFVLDALQLNTASSAIASRFSHFIGGIAAAIAMFIFLTVSLLHGGAFAVNSLPFIIVTVILYVLKDRVKELLKIVSFKQVARWFPDFTTEIRTADAKTTLGKIQETFSFVREEDIPQDIVRMRNREFHLVLEDIKRPEHVIKYKKSMVFYSSKMEDLPSRLKGVTVLFRMNIQKFLQKADDPSHDYLAFDEETKKLIEVSLPKMYHLNIIMKNSYLLPNGTERTELKKFRIIMDKNGIKHIEQPKKAAFEDVHV